MDSIKRYNKVKTNFLTNPKNINTYVPNPTEDDYLRGYITRFFIQKTNDLESPIYEVSSSSYRKYLNSTTYRGTSLRWRISGPLDTIFNDNNDVTDKGVQQSNVISISIASKDIKNLKLYLPNILQFYKK